MVGSAQIGAAVLTGFVGVTGVRLLHKFLFAAAAVAINTAALAAGYRWLCTQRSTWKQVAPGAVAAGVIFAGLQLTGTAIVGRAISNATPVYGTFSSVIGLVTWMSLHSAVALLGAEMNRSLPLRRAD